MQQSAGTGTDVGEDASEHTRQKYADAVSLFGALVVSAERVAERVMEVARRGAASSMQDVSLTLATLERLLCLYLHMVLPEESATTPQGIMTIGNGRRAQLTRSASSGTSAAPRERMSLKFQDMFERLNEELHALGTVEVGSGVNRARHGQQQQHHQQCHLAGSPSPQPNPRQQHFLHMLNGGTLSLLEYTELALSRLHDALAQPVVERLEGLRGLRKYWILALAVWYWSGSSTPLASAQTLVERREHWLFTWLRRCSGSASILYAVAAAFTQWQQRRWEARIREAHQKLSVCLRLWVLLAATLQYGKLPRRGDEDAATAADAGFQAGAGIGDEDIEKLMLADKTPQHTALVAPLTLEEHEAASDTLARRVLEHAPVPSTEAFWYEYSPRLLAIKRVIDVTYASVGTVFGLIEDLGISRFDEDRTRQYPSTAARRHMTLFRWLSPVLLPVVMAGYALSPSRASRDACRALSVPHLQMVTAAWSIAQIPLVERMLSFYLRRMYGLRQRELTIAGVRCMWLALDDFPTPELSPLLPRTTSRHAKTKPPSDGPLTVVETEEEGGKYGNKGDSNSVDDDNDADVENGIDVILYIPGGGFATHMYMGNTSTLIEWMRIARCTVIVPFYSLLPEHRFPTALLEICRVYQTLRSPPHARELLGRTVRAVCVSGDSAGGNLSATTAVALIQHNLRCCTHRADEGRSESKGGGTVRRMEDTDESIVEHVDDDEQADDENACILALEQDHTLVTAVGGAHDPIPLPDALMLAYPPLNWAMSPSPSRVISVGDPMLSIGLLGIISRMYLNGRQPHDPHLSPFHASDEILRCFPRTLIGVGALDSLLDDAVDFTTRLREQLHVPIDLHVLPWAPHGFLSFHKVLGGEACAAIRQYGEFIRDAFRDARDNRRAAAKSATPETMAV